MNKILRLNHSVRVYQIVLKGNLKVVQWWEILEKQEKYIFLEVIEDLFGNYGYVQ